MNVSEYVVNFLAENKIDRVFGVVGGAALWLCKALSENHYIKPVFTNHEQAATMAADGWARISGKPGIVFTINGPGMTNTVTGIAQAWVDSSPVILITGNSGTGSVDFERKNGLRQYGTQDVRTDLIMKPITKKTFYVASPEKIKAILQEAFFIAQDGRPGPVCIEIPINLQSAEVPLQMEGMTTVERHSFPGRQDISKILMKLNNAERPLIMAGQGIRLSGAVPEFRKFIEKMRLPVVTSRMGIDSIESASELFTGRPGNHGSRPSHFAIQTCDVMLVLGSRLAPNTTGYNAGGFSNQSYKILVDIDEAEIDNKKVMIDDIIHCDIKDFLDVCIDIIESTKLAVNDHDGWISCCCGWMDRYPVIQPEYYSSKELSTYRVVNEISKMAGNDDLILSDTGSCCSIVAQVWQVKKNQRVFISGGLSAMGYWATAMGLGIAKKQYSNVIAFSGDGSLQMNIHELATIKKYNIPIKLFVISNDGYQFVRMSQSAYGINPTFGTSREEGVPVPEIKKIVEAYGIQYIGCTESEKLNDTLLKAMETEGPVVCEIFVDENQEVIPRIKSIALEDGSFRAPEYENLYPFLKKNVLDKELRMIETKL